MKLRNLFDKTKLGIKKKAYVSIGFAGVLLAIGILFTLLVSSSSASEQNATSEGGVFNISDIQTLSINTNATPGTQDYSRSRVIARWQEPAQREAAAERFKAAQSEALKAAQGINATVAQGMTGETHYFGPYPNYANSPMPTGTITGITLTDGGSGYVVGTANIVDLYGTGTGGTANIGAVDPTTGAITALALTSGGSGYTAPTVTIVQGTDASATATATLGTFTGGIRKFVDTLPGLNEAGKNNLGQYIPIALPDTATYPPGGKGYTSAPTISISDVTGTGAAATAVLAGETVDHVTIDNGGSGYSANPTITFSGGGAATQAIGKATVVNGVITAINLIGCDYYEIELGEYTEKMHSDLPPTTLRGYRQTNTADTTVSQFHSLGPLIIADRDRPVRIKFTNKLPIEAGGDLFLPVDTTVMGAGMGPDMNMVTNLVQTAPDAVQITTMDPHTLRVGEMVMLHGFTPAEYNGEFSVIDVQDDHNFQIALTPTAAVATLGHITEMYAQNRATIHLHGGFVPWISDGTPHQWITPAGEKTQYPKGVSVKNVPDMGDPGDGSLTFYYNNQQSARLMFYHDHSYGITRLNVYAGEAAGYLITDQVEKDMIDGSNNAGVNPTNAKVLPGVGTPLIIQDRTFVDENTIAKQDPTWNWGSMAGMPMTGDLWYPHVYMPNQNPIDAGGMNAFGRWHFGPWFWPPTQGLTHPPIPNPYFGTAPYENNEIPATPNPSMAMEAFMDTPIVNGAAYPTWTVEPKAYRFRILNAADDRFLNLQLYQASNIISGITVTNGGTGYTNPKVTITDTAGTGKGATAEAIVDPTTGAITGITLLTVGSGYTGPVNVAITDTPPGTGSGAFAQATVYTGQTEVGMVPASPCTGLPAGWPTDGREGGVPDPDTAGPSFIQIGTEGGFLPAPAELPNLPVGWNFDQTNFDFGNVNQGTLILGTAERADVVVDFSKYAGKTLILYNDAPAPFPAIDPRYDYYTGHPDLTDTGGAPTTQPGYGPNTRTIMQIKVGTTVTDPVPFVFDLAKLKSVFAKTDTKRGVFEVSQDEIIVPQADYDSAYNKAFPADTYTRIFDSSKTFTTVSGATATIPLEPKAIQDEMGETYDTDYGRMSAMMGLQLPATAGQQAFTMYPYPSPPVDIVKGSVYGTPIGSFEDGTQIWKITHNGVDTHTIHVHLFNAQLINRVAWDNIIRVPDANELGWKETIRVSPLQDTIIALRPTAPTQPFDVPNSIRPLDPTMPLDEPLKTPPGGFKDPTAEPVTVVNHLVNYGWEYVWHCHLLAHEEMDMMHSLIFYGKPKAPSDLVATLGNSVTLTWKDNSADETGFTIQRAIDPTFTTDLTTFTVGPDVKTYTDTTVAEGNTYYYQVMATKVVGDTTVYAPPAVGFPTGTSESAFSAPVNIYVPVSIAAPTNLVAKVTGPARITLTWIDASNNEAKFIIWRSANSGTTYTPIGEVLRNAAQSASVGGTVTFADTTVVQGQTYMYYVTATNGAALLSSEDAINATEANVGGESPHSNTAIITFSKPVNPSGLTGTAVKNGNRYTITLNWIDNSNNENGFLVQRSISSRFAGRPSEYSVGADQTSYINSNVQRYSRGYYYRVRANNGLGNSGWSNVMHIDTK